ncbi:hypothetical protein [Streptomyces roseochromogenus]|uniref:Uncharacterized protein n=1 Tax=Streptomyces roseochromogenus subsp. oscitans DS 12.976 TaxID=1352936 RepID=V6KWW9_STRRC|nr:hypothetical protein [Streptomyces roseochromogenus]EST36622.1 hypothetical protein M878_01670 [Streptomyces roseochromogenus subsp. oscitans DS 12.976]
MTGDDARVAAVCQALAPLAWRSFTAEAVCRRAVVAMDLVQPSGPSPDAGHPSPDADQELLDVLVAFLAGHRWQSWTVTGLSRRLVSVVRAREEERMWFDIRLGWLLDEAG